ncbi:MAG: hypothetical protein N3D20_02240 [Candidatus Pacearchaeota archaeon]|nr:hypothetical protein [Candidatus Pacearchaeota archaeon]
MFWTKKEEKQLPDLPPLKPTFLSEEPKKEAQPLPSFPDVPLKKGFFQTATKEAVTEKEYPTYPDTIPANEETEADIMIEKAFKSHPDVLSRTKGKLEDVYVKIDRFHSARKALEHARSKIEEMDILLKKIREVRMREEQELSSWEKEVSSVKNKIEEITRNIFDKIE